MALQSSGPISLSDIAAEQGISTTNMSLRSMSNTAGFATPDAISDFYGYSFLYSQKYMDFTRGDAIKKSAIVPQLLLGGIQDITVSMWVKQGATQAAVENQILFDFAEATILTTGTSCSTTKTLTGSWCVCVPIAPTLQSTTRLNRINSSMGLGTNSSTLLVHYKQRCYKLRWLDAAYSCLRRITIHSC